MKRIIALVLTLASVLCLFAACVQTPAGTTNGKQPTTNTTVPGTTATKPTAGTTVPTEPTQPTEPTDPWAAYETITIAQALEMCEQFVEAPSTERYYIRATIVSIDNASYGQMTITDGTGEIMVYGTNSADGSLKFDKLDKKPAVGDEILIYGTLQYYKSNTKEVQNAWLIDFISNGVEEKPAELPADGTVLTIAEALEICKKLESGIPTTQRYYITATVESVTNAAYGSMVIADATGSISVYGSMNADGTVSYADMAEKPFKGDEVKIYCTLQNFNGNPEIKSAWIVEFKAAENAFNEADYTEMTIDAARDAATGTKVKITGVVARITFANGYKPSGVILVDGTNSIYVYDGDLASRVAIGNTITVAATKTYWILESESNSANKFGYQGCNQLDSAWLLSNDNGNSAFDKSWITESTVKEIMDTPANEDITTTIFKVNALIKRQDGNGFINYYIDDLDGVTGSYVYTQCNGGDFAWMDEFDGKICTVYLMAINAKSTASGCVWRFLPIKVIDEGFDVSTVNVPEFVVKYHGVTQFLATYSGDPAMALTTTISSELLNFTGAELTFTSNNNEVVYFVDGVMHCGVTGTAVITVSCTYNGNTYSEDFEISVKRNEDVAYISVADAIASAIGDKVVVKGIVGPSLVNQDGFYLIDETGIIAILTDKDTLATLELGYEIVLEGERYFKSKSGGNWGNTCISNAKVVVNNYGSHEYSTASFGGTLTLAEWVALSTDVDYTTTVFTVTATVEVVESAYYTNIKLVDGDVSINLYCSSAAQYKWLQQFAGQTITMEIAPCNWSSKSVYPGCVLAVILEDGSKIYNTLNFG